MGEARSARRTTLLGITVKQGYDASMLPPTSITLLDPNSRPYFIWWDDVTVGALHAHLASEDLEERAYWLGALLREANTRDVWLFTSPAEIIAQWPAVKRYLGRQRAMWAWLLKLDEACVA